MKRRSIVILMLGISCVLYSYFMMDQKKQPTKEEQKPLEEYNVDDQKTKHDLKELVRNLEGADFCDFRKQNDYKNGCIYQKDKIEYKELSFSYKLYSFLFNHLSFFTKKEQKIKWNQNIYMTQSYIKEENVKQEYQKIYGNKESFDLTKIDERNQDSAIIFDDNNHIFYLKKNQSEKPNQIKSYCYRYTKTNHQYYVYVSVAFIQLIGKDEYTNYEVYREKEHIDLNTEGIYKELDYFTLNQENYKEYSKYRYVFEKDPTLGYKFVQIEKIK